jgi:hypothetical protein
MQLLAHATDGTTQSVAQRQRLSAMQWMARASSGCTPVQWLVLPMDGSALLWPDGPFPGTALWKGLPWGDASEVARVARRPAATTRASFMPRGERRQAHADHRWAYQRVSDAVLAGTLPAELLDALLQVGVYRKPPIPALMTALAPLTAERGRVFRHRKLRRRRHRPARRRRGGGGARGHPRTGHPGCRATGRARHHRRHQRRRPGGRPRRRSERRRRSDESGECEEA